MKLKMTPTLRLELIQKLGGEHGEKVTAPGPSRTVRPGIRRMGSAFGAS